MDPGSPAVHFPVDWTISQSIYGDRPGPDPVRSHAIVPMKNLPPGKGVLHALKVDTQSLLAFEIGMVGWMALSHYVFFHPAPEPNNTVHWFMMRVGMVIG